MLSVLPQLPRRPAVPERCRRRYGLQTAFRRSVQPHGWCGANSLRNGMETRLSYSKQCRFLSVFTSFDILSDINRFWLSVSACAGTAKKLSSSAMMKDIWRDNFLKSGRLRHHPNSYRFHPGLPDSADELSYNTVILARPPDGPFADSLNAPPQQQRLILRQHAT